MASFCWRYKTPSVVVFESGGGDDDDASFLVDVVLDVLDRPDELLEAWRILCIWPLHLKAVV